VKVFRLADITLSELPNDGTAVALGRFDGVHIGHGGLISAMVDYARTNRLVPVVWVVNCTCRDRCDGEGCKGELLTNTSEKLALFRDLGVAYAVVEDFVDISHLSPYDFVTQKLHAALNCRVAFCGDNFRFGKGAQGDAATLREQMTAVGGQGFVQPFVTTLGEIVSSSAIRTALAKGDMKSATAMLGRAFSIRGTVVHGAKLGRKLGFPTANIPYPREKFTLPRGVYLSRFWVDDVWYPAVTNIGTRPSAGGGAVQAEAHLLDFAGDLYGKNATVELHEFLRPERKFASLDELREQIAVDVARARVGNEE